MKLYVIMLFLQSDAEAWARRLSHTDGNDSLVNYNDNINGSCLQKENHISCRHVLLNFKSSVWKSSDELMQLGVEIRTTTLVFEE